MTDRHSPSRYSKTTSTGHDMSESSYLDTHFEAMRPEYEDMIRSVGIQPGWQVLDAGSGSGAFLGLLADLVGPEGHISAIDLAPENIEVVETLVNSGRFDCSVEARTGEVTALPYQDNRFDAVWCANVTQYLTDTELLNMLVEFQRVVRPNGIVAIKEADLTVDQFIPGDPIAIWDFLKALRPINSQVRGAMRTLDLPIWFKQAGLIDIRYRTTICERQPPLRPAEEAFIGDVFRFYASIAENIDLPESVRLTWRKLGNINSSDHPLNHRDFYYREGASVVVARVPD